MQCGADELSRAEPELPFDAEPTLLEGLAVELGEQDALGEVERSDRDDVIAQDVQRNIGLLAVRTRGQHQHCRADHDDRRTVAMSNTSRRGRITSPRDST